MKHILNRLSPSLRALRCSALRPQCSRSPPATPQRRKSDTELGLNPQQAAGRKLYDNYCDRCHEPYSSRGKKGPSMKGIYKRQYMELSGLPVNDDRMFDIIKYGRSKMEGFKQVLTDDQIRDLIAYMHTL